MARQPIQVHVYLYKKTKEMTYEFAIFQRADNDQWWQGICGGVEENESLEMSARREVFEEAGIDEKHPLYPLESKSYLPVYIFSDKTQAIWGKDRVVVPMYFFAMPYEGPITLSDEHTDFKWLSYEAAEPLVYFHDQKTALWELKERLIRGNLF